MKKGDRVLIYEDPISCRKPEGMATLIEKHANGQQDGYDQWVVHFDGDDNGDYFSRVVSPRGEIRGTIGNYLKGKDEPSAFDLRCFAGMIETGEANLGDFMAVGGCDLTGAVQKAQRATLVS